MRASWGSYWGLPPINQPRQLRPLAPGDRKIDPVARQQCRLHKHGGIRGQGAWPRHWPNRPAAPRIVCLFSQWHCLSVPQEGRPLRPPLLGLCRPLTAHPAKATAAVSPLTCWLIYLFELHIDCLLGPSFEAGEEHRLLRILSHLILFVWPAKYLTEQKENPCTYIFAPFPSCAVIPPSPPPPLPPGSSLSSQPLAHPGKWTMAAARLRPFSFDLNQSLLK